MTIPVRIVSWNIQHGGGRRVRGILDQVRVWAPDCIVLLEYRGTEPSQRVGQGLAAMDLTFQVDSVDPVRPGHNAVLVTSRFPLRALPVSGLLADLRRWVGVEVRAPTPFVLCGMHVPNRAEGPKYAFHHAVAVELERHRTRPGIAVGDTNTGRRGLDEPTRFFNEAEHSWFDRMADAGWSDIYRVRHPEERVASWRSQTGGDFRLDQAFVTDEMAPWVRDVRYDWGEPEPSSDHAAVVLDVEMEG